MPLAASRRTAAKVIATRARIVPLLRHRLHCWSIFQEDKRNEGGKAMSDRSEQLLQSISRALWTLCILIALIGLKYCSHTVF